MSIIRIDLHPYPMAFIQECRNGRWVTWCNEFRGVFVPVEWRAAFS